MSGLYKFGGLVFVCILLLAGVLWLTDGDDAAVASPADGGAPVAEEALRAEDAPAVAIAAGEAGCAPDGAPVPLGDELRESSGVAASRAHAGIAWTHNDSGDPVLFAVDARGRTAGRVSVTGATVEDWEDISIAPCPGGGDCLYVADIGDNDAARGTVTVWRVPEPAPGDARTAPATAIRLRYPDGAHDAEAMFVLDGAIHLVTKGETGPIAIYRAPAGAGAEATLERVRTLSAEKVKRQQRVTSADASADGRWVAMRTLRDVSVYPAAALLGSGEVSPRRVDVKSLDEEQGEGIGFAPGGALLLTSEGSGKTPATLARLACTLE